MKYRAHLNLDFTQKRGQHYQKLIAALLQAGWVYVETSALIIETNDLRAVWAGIELVAKQSESAGQLSALTFHIQGSADFAGQPYVNAANHPHALVQIMDKPMPTEGFY